MNLTSWMPPPSGIVIVLMIVWLFRSHSRSALARWMLSALTDDGCRRLMKERSVRPGLAASLADAQELGLELSSRTIEPVKRKNKLCQVNLLMLRTSSRRMIDSTNPIWQLMRCTTIISVRLHLAHLLLLLLAILSTLSHASLHSLILTALMS
ncbi:hypothetical protein VTO42DRAFT_6382 [Malbranchea cinnamomea]